MEPVRLDGLDLSKALQSRPNDKVHATASASGNPLKIGGKTYESGIGTQAECYLQFQLDGKASRFVAKVGIDEDAENFWGTGCQFWIEGDGKILAKSGRMRRRDAVKTLEADLTGIKTVTLVTAAAGFSVRGDHGDWVDAEFTMQPGAKPIAAKLQPDSPELLTPAPSAKPRITGPKVFGVRPGNPVLFPFTATGKKPVTFSAKGIPLGLKLDSATGMLSGSVSSPGNHQLLVEAKNSSGTAKREFTLKVGEAIALTPPLGWNSWNSWGWNVTQKNVEDSARTMSELLRDHGWTYVNVDDTWQGKRGGPFNAIQPNKNFPDLEGMVARIHALGLKAGIYSSPWMGTYASHIGGSADRADGIYDFLNGVDEPYRVPNVSQFQRFGKTSFAENDAKQFAAWGFDYLKYDWNPIDPAHTKVMFDCLRASGRDISFSLSNGARVGDAAELAKVSQAWRTSGDMSDNWGSIRDNAFEVERWIPFQAPGHWNDEDMLVVGRVTLGDAMHTSYLTPSDPRLHITQWSLLGSPLLIGCDLAHLDPLTLDLLTNDEVIDINQDSLGVMARPIKKSDADQVWVKPLDDGSLAVGLFNVSEEPRNIGFTWGQIGLKKVSRVRDVWRQRDIRTSGSGMTQLVRRHGAVLLRLFNH